MYSTPRLDTPPPSSRFRRPWSPDPYDPLPPTSRQDDYDYSLPRHYQSRQREPSDVSVEALDLADYAMTLNRNNNRNVYQQPAFIPHDAYPPSPPPLRPLASPESARTPSLTSPSVASSQSFSDYRAPIRRPFSLPTPSVPHHPLHSHTGHPRQEPQAVDSDPEIDIAHFPSFSHAWYENDRSKRVLSPPLSAYGGEVPPVLSPFDPAFPTHSYDASPYSPYASSPPPSYPHLEINSRSSRDIIPWGGDQDSNLPVGPQLKEERLRMLEREFGGKQPLQPKDEEHAVGSVDSKGKLITGGPKRRLAARCIQVLLALTASVSSIYAALVIKPLSAPPPRNTLAAYILYVLSVLSFLAITVFFFIYPCCCGGRRTPKDSPYTAGPSGMMVLPIQALPGGKKAKGGKKGMASGEGVQVNLIVDPTMFGGRERERDADWEQQGDDGSSEFAPPGSSTYAGRPRRAPKRRGIFAGLAMEAQWKQARKMLKWGMVFDVVAMVLWGAEFVIILLGKRCPSGGYDGWCEAYNLATAAACLSCLAFMFSIYFDIKDLHASKASPRTRPL
ncbi:hypothetical protein B0H21DRAFT_782882 [Amylocystis lapponica]|nr:hypothetical protein B0H21DRAFT_782882 [Amylocystis lapponica]